MILSIRNSFLGKAFSFLMIFVFFLTLNPQGTFALTGGPAQPEFNSFTPIGTSDMVDLSSGDFSYNIPLMDVGGFPINLAYKSGVTMDQEASWVGLGWDLSIGQINRQMRGLPDDFNGDEMTYKNNIKDNFTVGGTVGGSAELVGVDVLDAAGNILDSSSVDLNGSISTQYNSYNGVSLSPSLGISFDIAKMGSVGFNASATPDGLVLSPSVSLNPKVANNKIRRNNLGASFGISFNSRQGLSTVNMSTSYGWKQGKIYQTSDKKVQSGSAGSGKSFFPNTYTPTIQSNVITASGTFNFAVGTEVFGIEGELEQTYFFSNQFMHKKVESKKAYGYDHTEKADAEGVLDFNREKDGVFTENSTNLPLTNYTYDLYSVQGQGVSGMFQPFRSQVGYVYNDLVRNNEVDLGLGGEVGTIATVHAGVDGEATVTDSKTGVWTDENLSIGSFQESETTPDVNYEEVYYKNVGDLSVDDHLVNFGDAGSANLGGYQPITLKIGGAPYARQLENTYEVKNKPEWNINPNQLKRANRAKRNQTIQKITAEEATMANAGGNQILPNFIANDNAKPHHTAGFIITRNDGARYNYGKALYNTTKKEVSFALGSGIGGGLADKAEGDVTTGLVPYVEGVDNSVDNKHGDHYYNSITTPEYAHTYLLTSLLSTDYSDIDGIAGPSAGDFGSYTKFEYRTMDNLYKWRVPFQKDKASWNEGLKTDPTDDKGSYIYGEKELSYIQKIETKTHVALFYISPRKDGYGVGGPEGGRGDDSKMYKLDKVMLFSAGELYDGVDTDGIPTIKERGTDENGNITTTATPIKTVHFVYDYSQCQGIHNNKVGPLDENELSNDGGKLTLKKVYFTYRDSKMGKYSPYKFVYGDIDHNGEISADEDKKRNPRYNLKGYDIWGAYKPNDLLDNIDPAGKTLDELTAPEFNYVEQNTVEAENRFDDYAASWSITDIELPSGGEIQIDYEADDYQYVQDQKAMRMFKLAGTGYYADPFNPDGDVDDFDFDPENSIASQGLDEGILFKGARDANYLYFELDDADQDISEEEFREKYLSQIINHQNNLVQFRVLMNMTKKGGKSSGNKWKDEPFDYVTGYFELDHANGGSTTFHDPSPEGKTYGSVKMTLVEKEGGLSSGSLVNPIAKAGWQFGRKYLSRFILGGEDTDGDGGTDVAQIAKKLTQFMKSFPELFKGPNGLVKGMNIGRRIIPEKSWIRLSEPSQYKKGGGCRVRQIAMTDDWAAMTESTPGGIMDQKYGQQYVYELKDGGSSGVATYEPVGSKENPFVQPVYVNINRVLAPNEENYIEKPFGESFFPNPTVTYSRVAVKNLERRQDQGTPDDRTDDITVTKHATGEVVTEFYTSKDFPTQTDQTELDPKEDHNPLISNLLKVNVVKHLTLSQGYVIHLNDMNGKMKGQRVYAEGQEEPISGVDYEYDLHPSINPDDYPTNMVEAFNNKGRLNNKVLSLDPNGTLTPREIGIEHTIINDFREMRSVTNTAGINYNTAGFPIGPLPIIVPVPLPDYNRHVDQLRISTTTKVINTYGIMKKTIAYDAGAAVSTRNVVWDSETGEVLVTETVNEYGDNYYSFNYPAHWNYKGMGQAAFNSGTTANISALGSGYQLEGAVGNASNYVQPGDEMILVAGDAVQMAWVNTVSSGAEFSLIDRSGNPITVDGGTIKIIRSGRRNLQSSSMGSIVMMENPVTGAGLNETSFETSTWDSLRIVNAGAVEFKEEWDLQCECGIDPINNVYNPYLYNTMGVWRADKSYLYLTGRHHYSGGVDPRNDGFYNDFEPYYKLNAGGNWSGTEDISLSKWTFTSQVSSFSPYGFELENEDALERKSAAQYGYNFSFPLAVGANSAYSQMGYDGFEDYNFNGCDENEHFGFREVEPGDPNNLEDAGITNVKSHTGRFSLKVTAGNRVIKGYRTECE